MAETTDEQQEIRDLDMYGNRIHPIGETGYGASITFYGNTGEVLRPMIALFHVSDGFRQALTCFMPLEDDSALSVFHDRVAEVLATEPHGRGR